MIFNILLLFRGLFRIYHTSRFYTYITNIRTLFLTITLSIFFQVLFVDQFFPYRTKFSTEYTNASILQKHFTS